MRKTIPFLAILVAIVLGTVSLSSSKKANSKNEIQQKYAYELKDEIDQLTKIAEAFRYEKGTNEQELKDAVRSTRNAYKKIGFLLSYFYPDYTEEHLNGAPILHIKREVSRAGVSPPEGLQTIDELSFLEAENERTTIHQLSQKLAHSYNVVLKDFERKEIQTTDLISAMRQEIIAIFTLGLTGFDTPGSLNGIEESKQSLFALQKFSEVYFGDAADQLSMKFQLAMAYLEKNKDFNSFNRLEFLKEHLNPLYKDILVLAESNGVKSAKIFGPWNERSENIFSADFLDPYFFTELSKFEDSPQLRELGKALFYDKDLSSGMELSCGSCHKPELGFADGKPRSSSNVEGKTVLRNAPTLLNAAYADRYFYDLRAFTLEQQAEHVIFNSLEFNSAYSQIIERLESKKDYKQKFKSAYGNTDISRERLVKALSSYVVSLQSFNSPFDKYVRSETERISDEVKRGFNLFMGKAACGTCHFAPTFAGLVPPNFTHSESEILGVLQSPGNKTLDTDPGRIENGISNEEAWIYKRSFKTVSVRNVELTGPYFHNGAYGSLQDVLEFYNRGGGAGIGIDVPNQTLSADPLDLTDDEMNAIISFMKALTDNSVAELDLKNEPLNEMVNQSN